MGSCYSGDHNAEKHIDMGIHVTNEEPQEKLHKLLKQ